MDSSSSESEPVLHTLAPHLLPIASRRRPSLLDSLRLVTFNALFILTCAGILCIQLFFALPCILISRRLYRRVIGFSRATFGRFLVGISASGGASFGPTEFVITSDESVDLEGLVRRDQAGNPVGLELARNSDWVYLWILLSLSHLDSGLIIVLKATLRWVPLVGATMQFFRFAFVGKTMPITRTPLASEAKHAVQEGSPFAVMLFPEGTLFAVDTQLTSDAFALRTGVPPMRNVLLPKSTGLLYTLRTLLALTDDVKLYDLTIGYPGVPAAGYAEEYYTLFSVFGRRHPPPAVHLHIRLVDLSYVPSLSQTTYSSTNFPTLEEDLSPTARAEFQEWTRTRWVKKDALMDTFCETDVYNKH
ncbi:hypothetical protein RQP46_007311 [Phenoliferia psychrophenolica]